MMRVAMFGVLVVAVVSAQPPQTPSNATLFEGGRLIVDARRPPIENAALLVVDGRVVSSGRQGRVTAPPGAVRVDFSGKTIMPALVDAHVHLGYQVGLN